MQKGQALLLILLSMSVVLVVALSIVSRSVTDISITSKQESSTRAFNAAESGVERVLVTGTNINNASLGDANFTANVTAVGKALNSFSYPAGLKGGESASVWLVSRDATGAPICNGSNPCFKDTSIKVCWGNTGTPANASAPALEIQYYYTTPALSYLGTKIATATYDPFSSRAGNSGNNFLAPDAGTCLIGTKTYPFQKTLNLTNAGTDPLGNPASTSSGTSLNLNVRLLYNSTPHEFGVTAPAGATFPAQGNLIDSTGDSGGANRRLNVFQSVGDNPSVFDGVVYSEGDLSKN